MNPRGFKDNRVGEAEWAFSSSGASEGVKAQTEGGKGEAMQTSIVMPGSSRMVGLWRSQTLVVPP